MDRFVLVMSGLSGSVRDWQSWIVKVCKVKEGTGSDGSGSHGLFRNVTQRIGSSRQYWFVRDRNGQFRTGVERGGT